MYLHGFVLLGCGWCHRFLGGCGWLHGLVYPISEESMDVEDSDDGEWVDRDGNAFDAFKINDEEED